MYTEATLGVKCDLVGSAMAEQSAVNHADESQKGPDTDMHGKFYSDPFHNNPSVPAHYQGVVATVTYDTTPSSIDVEKKIRNEVIIAMHAREQRQVVPVKI
jgi:hypothetical protein